MKNLKDSIVVVTGASSGIGAACARTFLEQGARVIAVARRGDRLEELARNAPHGSDALALELDVRDRTNVARTFDALPESWRSVDILVNNAGLSRGLDPIQSGSIDDWEEMIDTNIKGLLYVTRALLPGMVERGRGHVINIGSIAGHEVYPKGNVYCATKHAVDAITKGMQLDLNGTGVRVTTVDPGLAATEFSSVRFRGDSQRADAVYDGYRPLSGEDVASVVLFAATLPEHMYIKEMIVMPSAQASATVVDKRR
jgi:serine 3-dehydrogenase